MRTRLLPLASVVTPNIPEAELLLGQPIADSAAADAALESLQALGAQAVLLKGGHLDEGDTVVDRFAQNQGRRRFEHPRLAREGHGTGCTLAAAIAANLCLGRRLPDACAAAIAYVHDALREGYRPGRGDVLVLDHAGTRPAP